MRFYFSYIILLVYPLLTACENNSNLKDNPVILDNSYYTDLYNFNQTGNLGRGINMGNFLESPVSAGGEGAWVNGTGYPIQQQFFTEIKDAGFKTVRIPIRWSDYTGDVDPYEIDTTFLNRIKTVADWALGENLIVVINVHHYVEMMDSDDLHDLSYHKTRLNSIWVQICEAFIVNRYPVDSLYFELLNEPNDRVTYDEWNGIIADLTSLIRSTEGQMNRKIVIGTANWGGVPGLQKLELPAECNSSNTIITYHYYEPFHFTHQGASWVDGSSEWLGTSWTGTSAQQQEVTDHFDDVVEWNNNNGNYQLWMGEFGALSSTTENVGQRAWTAFVAREAESRGIAWAYWEFCSGFGAYNYITGQWRDYLLNGPLIPVGE